jgi:transposase
MFQKSVVKCQSTFERIREAYAEIRGFQYRPAPMSEAYSYGIQKDNKSEKNINKTQSNKTQSNKTQSNKTQSNNSSRKLR